MADGIKTNNTLGKIPPAPKSGIPPAPSGIPRSNQSVIQRNSDAVKRRQQSQGIPQSPGTVTRTGGLPGMVSKNSILNDAINQATNNGIRVDNNMILGRFNSIGDSVWCYGKNRLSVPVKDSKIDEFLKSISEIINLSNDKELKSKEYVAKLERLKKFTEEQKDKVTSENDARIIKIKTDAENQRKQIDKTRDDDLKTAAIKIDNMRKSVMDKHEKTYGQKVKDAENAITFVSTIMDKFDITKSKYPCYVSASALNDNMTVQKLVALVKNNALRINEISSSNVSMGNSIVNKVKQLGDDKGKAVAGGGLVAAVALAPLSLAVSTAALGKAGLQERTINKEIKELSTSIVQCHEVLKLLKRKYESEYDKNKPADISFKKEQEKMEKDIENIYRKNLQEIDTKFTTELNNCKNVNIQEALDRLDTNKMSKISALDKNLQEFTMDTDVKVKTISQKLYNELTEFTTEQKEPVYPYDSSDKIGDQIKVCKDNIAFKNKKDIQDKLNVFAERDLLETLQYKLYPNEKFLFSEIKNKIKYDWDLYKKFNRLQDEINELIEDIVKTDEFKETGKATDEASVKAYLEELLQKRIQQETELFLVNTSDLYLGQRPLTQDMLRIPDTLKKYMHSEEGNFVLPVTKLKELVKSRFSNKSILCIYDTQQEMEIMANFVKYIVYSILYSYHVESCVVNVINPDNNTIFSDLQVSRDYVSTKKETEGKVIKGKNYVSAFLTKSNVDSLYKSLEELDDKRARTATRGLTFEQLVKSKRGTGAIVPQFTVNVLVDMPLANPFSRFNTGTGDRGIMNIHFIQRGSVLKKEYNSSESRYEPEKVDVSTISACRKYDNIVEILVPEYEDVNASALNYKRAVFGVTYKETIGNPIQQTFIYDIKSPEQFKTFNLYLRERALLVGNNTSGLVTRDFVADVIRTPMQVERKKQVNKLKSDREILEQQHKYVPFLKKKQKLEKMPALEGEELEFAYFLQEKREKELEYKIATNPDGYWEGNCEKTISLYFGYVEGDKSVIQPTILDETSKPHIFLAGTTGGGKSNTLGVVVNVLKMMYSPEDIEVVYFDFKVVEVALHAAPYKMPHCSAMCGSSESEYLISLLNYVNGEMDRRYDMNKQMGTSKLSELREVQQKAKQKIIDKANRVEFKIHKLKRTNPNSEQIKELERELADLLREADNVEITPRMLLLVDEAAQAFQTEDDNLKMKVKSIFVRLGQLARAAGIHMCLVSQDADKMPSALFDLLAIRGCTVAPKTISKNVMRNDFCAKPENQFQGFFGINANGGNEEDNIQYVVPYNNPDDATKVLSKVADALCVSQHKRSRDAVIFSDDEVYSNEQFDKWMIDNQDKLDGRNIYLGEGVYFQKEFSPHRIRINTEQRSGLSIISTTTEVLNNMTRVVLKNLQEHAYIYPVYCKEIPDMFTPEFFYTGKNKRDGVRYGIYAPELIRQKDAITEFLEGNFDQVFEGDYFGDFENPDEPLVMMEDEKEVVYTKDALKKLDKQSSWYAAMYTEIDYRTKLKREDKSTVFTPIYYVVFNLSSHKKVINSPYEVWRELPKILNEASPLNIHVIFVDQTLVYHDKGLGGYYLVSNISAIQDKPREFKTIAPNYAKLLDIQGVYTALVKIPRDDPKAEETRKENDEIKQIIESGRATMSEDEVIKYTYQ